MQELNGHLGMFSMQVNTNFFTYDFLFTSSFIIGSLLGKSCQGTLKLAGHSEDLQQKGYLFGKHLALAWQACLDREPFSPGSSGQFSLVSAPVLFGLQHDPSLYSLIEIGEFQHLVNI